MMQNGINLSAVFPSAEEIGYIWTRIKNDPRPKVIYGTGNGADKILAVCDREGVSVLDCAVSDGFAKGQAWRDGRVISLTEACDKYDSCIFIVAFATREGEVIDRIRSLEPRHSVYVPDVPVTDGALFSDSFYSDNLETIKSAYSLFADDISRQIYENVIKYKLSGRLYYLEDATSEDLSFVDFSKVSVAVDCGAYDGDTIRALAEVAPSLKRAYAIEPDRVNFRKLSAYAEAESRFEVIPIKCAVWREDSETEFFAGGNRGSSLFYVGYKAKREKVSLRALDGLIDEAPDYIKFDTEGAESEAIEGVKKILYEYRPIIKISAYHRSEDLFVLTKKIAELDLGYEIYLRRNRCIPAWEAELYAVPKDKTRR